VNPFVSFGCLLPIVEYLERPSTLNVGTFIFMHAPDTALIMTADTISGYMQRLLDGVESSSKLPTRWTAIHLKAALARS
jgi:hypothetical protein